jgi:hypothetical protein
MKPAAFIPILMSLSALFIVLVHWTIFGIVHDADEGTLAHIFQLLIVAQLPIAVYFLFRWGDKKPKETLKILVLQAIALLAAITAVFFLT